jgi:mono/diheme cytochrome c family protein
LLDHPERLVVTTAGESNAISVLEVSTGGLLARWPAGHGVCSPVVSPSRNRLYVCNRFEDAVAVHAMASGKVLGRIAVRREPVAAALSPDERTLAVANLLPDGAANAASVSAAVSLVDTSTDTVRAHVRLPSGSTLLWGIAVSPDGGQCAVVHNLARFQVPTTQLEHGWMNASALSLIDLRRASLIATVLLDEPRCGAANPWGVAWSAAGGLICVAHAGTHELSLVEASALKARLAGKPEGQLVADLDLLRGIRDRISLRGRGPRCLAVVGSQAYMAEFFSDTLSTVDLKKKALSGSLVLGTQATADPEREGERLFHDATISRQSWQSCASCHPEGRVDGLNWDLLNDGIGNPKNTKSLLLSHRTAPAMSLGVRTTAAQAVRSGLRHILFALRPEVEAQAIDAYLSALRPVPSPGLAGGQLSAAAQRGQRLFEAAEVGCAACHPAPLFTDSKAYAVGTQRGLRAREDSLDTPTLLECWRTAPYLHDGSATSLREVLTTNNPQDRHGKTSHLAPNQIEDLVAYLTSL